MPTGHAAAATEPARQKEPAGHAVQPADDVTFMPAEKEPAGHCVGATLPAGQKLPAGHAVQLAWLVRFVTAPKEPAAHGFALATNDPAGQ